METPGAPATSGSKETPAQVAPVASKSGLTDTQAPAHITPVASKPGPQDSVWFVPFQRQEFISAYQARDDQPAVKPAQPFTVSIREVYIASTPHTNWLNSLLHPSKNVLILSTATMGSKPPVERVHGYFEPFRPKQVLNDFLSDTVYVSDDYDGESHLWLQVQVVVADKDPASQHALINSFTGLSNAAGAIFPVMLQFSMAETVLASAVNKLLDSTTQQTQALTRPVNLKPKGEGYPILRPGYYILFDDDVDASQYTLDEELRLERADGAPVDVTYAVLTISIEHTASPDFVISQRVATLLTGLKNGSNDPTKSAVGFLTDTMQAYSNFMNLKRYQELKAKQKASTAPLDPPELDLMARLAKDAELAPFLQNLP